MQIGKIDSSSSRLTDTRKFDAAPEIVKDKGGRALVVVEPEREALGSGVNFRQASFLAHLIATKDKHPQTRERRRAHPAVAIHAYRTAGALVEE